MPVAEPAVRADADSLLPLTLLSRYLFFLGRRPVSSSNAHFLSSRLASLQSLAPRLREVDDPAVQAIAAQLRSLTIANLSRLGPALQIALVPFAAEELPRDVAVSRSEPPRAFWADAQRVLLVFAPGIGVGDEILCFSIPAALRGLAPNARIEVMTTYAGLWDRVSGVDAIERYRELDQLVARFRGLAPSDLVVVVDFECPGLAAAIAGESRIPRYAEISLGARLAVAMDSRDRRMWQMPPLDPYCQNYYAALERALTWLGAGLPARPAESAFRRHRDPAQPFTILVSPFTSKHDPSELYWSRLLTSLVPPGFAQPIHLAIDSGPNAATLSFARALERSARAQANPRVTVGVLRSQSGGSASLRDVLDRLPDADLVVATDSYLAHAAPALGIPAFIVATRDLAPWRAPSPGSFYFGALDPVLSVGESMQALLREMTGTSDAPCARPEARRLDRASRAVRSCLDRDAAPAETSAAWDECRDACRSLLSSLPSWPAPYETVFADHDYAALLPPAPRIAGTELAAHLRHRLAEWENSNLRKYVALDEESPS